MSNWGKEFMVRGSSWWSRFCHNKGNVWWCWSFLTMLTQSPPQAWCLLGCSPSCSWWGPRWRCGLAPQELRSAWSAVLWFHFHISWGCWGKAWMQTKKWAVHCTVYFSLYTIVRFYWHHQFCLWVQFFIDSWWVFSVKRRLALHRSANASCSAVV